MSFLVLHSFCLKYVFFVVVVALLSVKLILVCLVCFVTDSLSIWRMIEQGPTKLPTGLRIYVISNAKHKMILKKSRAIFSPEFLTIPLLVILRNGMQVVRCDFSTDKIFQFLLQECKRILLLVHWTKKGFNKGIIILLICLHNSIMENVSASQMKVKHPLLRCPCHVIQCTKSLNSSILIYPLITAKLLLEMEIEWKDVIKKKKYVRNSWHKSTIALKTIDNHSSEA